MQFFSAYSSILATQLITGREENNSFGLFHLTFITIKIWLMFSVSCHFYYIIFVQWIVRNDTCIFPFLLNPSTASLPYLLALVDSLYASETIKAITNHKMFSTSFHHCLGPHTCISALMFDFCQLGGITHASKDNLSTCVLDPSFSPIQG